jgi:hypothetical protein
MSDAKRYPWVWWAWTLLPWLLVTGTYAAAVVGAFGHLAYLMLLPFDAGQHLGLASPLLGAWRARRALRNVAARGSGRWMLTSPTPLWALGWAGCSALTTILGVVAVQVPYVGVLAVAPLIGVRVLMNLWWFFRGSQDSMRVAMLVGPDASSDHAAFVLHARGRETSVTLSDVDDFTQEIRIRRGGPEEEVWKVVGPIDDLVDVVRREKGRSTPGGRDGGLPMAPEKGEGTPPGEAG